MTEIILYRRDYAKPQDGSGDYFNDIVINLGLAPDYDAAFEIDEVEIVGDHAKAIT